MTQIEMFPTAISSQPVIPANRSPTPVSASDRRMTATSGRTCCKLLHKNDRLGAVSKTFMVTSAWASTKCYLTWKPKATPAGRLLFQLAASMRHTSDSEPSLFPTPTANEDAAGTPNGKMQRMLGNHPAIRGTTPEEWKTGSLNPQFVEWLMGYPAGWTNLETPQEQSKASKDEPTD